MSPLEIEFQQKFHKTEISMHESRRRRRFCNLKMEKCMARRKAEEERARVQMMCKFYLEQAKCTHTHTVRSI